LQPQLVGFLQDGQLVAQTETHLQVTLKFQPQADGVTFKLGAGFYDSVPAVSSRLADWTQMPTNAPLGHAASGTISIDPICGPVEKISADTFAFHLQKETLLTTNARNYELVFAATHPGDARFKPAVQQAHLFVPARNNRGTEQHISFPEIPNQTRSRKSLTLAAASDANLPVCFLVREGPAEVSGNTLTLTRIPPRAKFPVKITVVAWQYGRSIEPKVKTAEPVERIFYVVK
jgi:hypothetical protein